jgi:uncharacterized membrane protein YphA (DoxX/SURF4 family)
MTSLPSLLTIFAIIGGILTFLTRSTSKNLLMSFLQYFCGVWFIFSGLVKAVDPIGTAYKMEDYFVQFESTFAGLQNFFSGLAPMFPALSKQSTGFSIFMVALEIILGVMLMVGYRRKFTAWLFFLIVVFFTLLTGFTYMTGYVPSEANFFDFTKWGPYVKTQMRVTDCGCFGDFIKLDPRISFFKDLGLMIPALFFLFRSKWMHQIFTGKQGLVVLLVTVATAYFCYYNTYQNLPIVDFRPFKIGNNIREMKEMEAQARSNVQVIGWVLENTNTGEVKTFMEPDPKKITYYKEYPKADGWKVKDQIKTEPYIEKDGQKVFIKETKVSDFAVEDAQNGEVGEDLLGEKGYSLMIVAYHLEGKVEKETYTVRDTVWASDTLRVNKDSITITKRFASENNRQETREIFIPETHYGDLFKNQVNPAAEAAQKAGWKVYAITAIPDGDNGQGLRTKTGATYPFYRADEKLLKTIIRANPGFVVLKDGVVLDMYHHKHLPTGEALLAKHK